ncbi:SRPBCC domain-containing protein [Staphylococcus saprophyticus]|uniref:SRPBCC family protein n=1 Tax=Staphylococcus saprophyticus TaxID=29385 RepID=UPI0019317072|nr:SRPBCC domain-containing protein [Staphylococcus saprophyticus]MBM0845149.1 SRPBCC domain-containing protein [Staphylococcus saprophyticus]
MSVKIVENNIIFTREFKATAEQIFKAYTDQNLFEKWFHPQGATTEVYESDVQTGGNAFFAIRAPQGTSYTVTQYTEVIQPTLIDYNDYFADKDGNIDQKMAGMHNTIHIEDNDNGVAKLTSAAVLPDPKAAQQLLDMGVEEGMNSTFDNLETLLETL